MTQQISWDEFDEQYKPVQNHLNDNAEMGGIMYEFGRDENNNLIPEYQYVWDLHKTEPTRVWTVLYDTVNRDEHGTKLSEVDVMAGWHVCNRGGYIITENHWSEENIEVLNFDFDDEDDLDD
jgi:hypothetical protein